MTETVTLYDPAAGITYRHPGAVAAHAMRARTDALVTRGETVRARVSVTTYGETIHRDALDATVRVVRMTRVPSVRATV